jgi:transposase
MKQTPDKTDFGDARVLADLERVGYLPRVWLAPLAVRELRRLSRFRQQLANQRRTCKLRIRALLRDGRVKSPPGRAWSAAWMKWLRQTAEVSLLDSLDTIVIMAHVANMRIVMPRLDTDDWPNRG